MPEPTPLPRHRCSKSEPHLQHIEREEGPEPEFLCDGVPGQTDEEKQAELAQRYAAAHPEQPQEPSEASPASKDPQEAPAAPESGTQPQPEQVPSLSGNDWGQTVPQSMGQVVQRPPISMTSALEQAVAASCYQHANGERVEYAISLTVVANQNGEMQPVYVLVLALPGLVVGERAHGSTLIQNLWTSGAEIDGMVQRLLEMIRQQRSAHAQQVTANHNPQQH